MQYLKTLASSAAIVVLMTGAASALTITNQNSEEISFGVDQGAKETVHKIPAGESLTLKNECKEGCGLTGPWGYSEMAKAGDTYVTEGDKLTLQE